jgi:isocitrate/isopropylmalate dehydrogenase
MLLEFLGESDAADRINKAVSAYVADPSPDLSTSAIGDLVAERV